MKKLLLHICCAHCAAYPVEYWREQGCEVTSYWYNPNIHPYLEHQSRLEATEKLAGKMNFPLITAESYDMVDYFRRVVGHESERCADCYTMRLEKTARAALKLGFDAFTSTLLISHQQVHELIEQAGKKLENETGVEFLYADLRKHYSDSRRLTKPLGLYRQQYCGCVYSEWERYTGKTIS